MVQEEVSLVWGGVAEGGILVAENKDDIKIELAKLDDAECGRPPDTDAVKNGSGSLRKTRKCSDLIDFH